MEIRRIVFCLSAALIIFSSCADSSQSEYVPSKEFIPAYNALVGARDGNVYQYQTDSTGMIKKVQCDVLNEGEEFYDIEETVRILNGLEVAQMQASDFFSFLEYMAKQDYSMVPKEVVSAKMELLPVLQEMYILEQENLELEGLTGVMSCLGTGVYALAKDRNITDQVAGVLDVVGAMSNPITGITSGLSLGTGVSKMVGMESLDAAKTAAFDHYEEQQKLKSENKKRIDQLKARYLVYLEEFTPIYMKYMNEWDRLCIDKDKAYLAIYAGRYSEGYSVAQEILDKYPANREAMLLKSLACINLARNNGAESNGDGLVLKVGTDGEATAQKLRFTIEAQRTLENYIDLYPSKAAPALLLLGEIELMNGNADKAISLFDQSAIEYPKQAAELKDMLNSYALRRYLNATPEGLYLMRLYNSTMEGYGWFSPNFHKALYWESVGDSEKASLEIYNHFFRRGNQGLYDCLLTDMEFCENNLYKSFKSQFMEGSVLNVSVAKDTHVFGKNGIRVSLANNADIDLENVRLYICLHLKDMYVSEYVVFPCETINILAPGTDHSWVIDGYQIEDIVRARAILMTDDRVCWVDDVNFKQAKAKKGLYRSGGKQTKSLDMFEEYGLSDGKIAKSVASGVNGQLITPESGFLQKMVGSKNENCLVIKLPRSLCLLDPVFSMGELSKNCTPSRTILEGSVIKLEFKLLPDAEYEPIYLYSDFINMKIDYELDADGKVVKTSTEVLK